MIRLKVTIFLYSLLLSCTILAQNIAPTGSLLTARWWQQAKLLYNGKVLVCGGDNCSISPVTFNSAELYTPGTGTWATTLPMNKRRTNFASAITSNGNILIIGGKRIETGQIYASCEAFQTQSPSWNYVDSMNYPREGHDAVNIGGGRILVAGGLPINNTSEFYDQSTNNWIYSGNLIVSRGFGLTLTLLADGRVLAIGGDNSTISTKTGELYDPVTGTWTLIADTLSYPRSLHSAVLLNDGRVLIAGGTGLTPSTTAELYDPVSNTFSPTGNISDQKVSNPMVALDNGGAMIYGIGNVMAPNDTRCAEFYNVVPQNWTSNNYNIIGGFANTLTRLYDGRILAAGGSPTTLGGASAQCYLFTQPLQGTCIPINSGLAATGQNICYGIDGHVYISNAETGVTYRCYIGGNPVGAPATGGGNITITIPALQLGSGMNIVQIRASRLGCADVFLNDTARILAPATIPAPTISVSPSTSIFSCDTAVLNASGNYPSYLWTNGSLLQSISINTPGSYAVQAVSGNGCMSNLSAPVNISISPVSTVNAGPPLDFCISTPPSLLIGASPAGGIWSGPGISSGGFFNPSLADTGTHLLTYTVCDSISVRTINVHPDLSPYVSIAITTGTNPTGPNSMITFTATPFNGGTNPIFVWKKNGVVIGSNSNTLTLSGVSNNDVIFCILTSNATCLTQTSDTSNIITLAVFPHPTVLSITPTNHFQAINDSCMFQVKFSNTMDTSGYSISDYKLYATQSGFHTFALTWITSDSLTLQTLAPFLPGERVYLTLKGSIRDSIGIELLYPLTFSFISEAGIGPMYFYQQPDLNFYVQKLEALNVADFNNDRFPDMVAVYSVSNTMDVFINDGFGSFSAPVTYSIAGAFGSSGVSDFNEDGFMDIVTVHQNTPGPLVSIYQNDGTGNFLQPLLYYGINVNYNTNVQTIDVDGDGDIDLACASLNKVDILKNDGAGNFSYYYTSFGMGGINSFGAGDFDNDYDLDLFSGSQANDLLLKTKNDRTGRFVGTFEAHPVINNDLGDVTIFHSGASNRADIFGTTEWPLSSLTAFYTDSLGYVAQEIPFPVGPTANRLKEGDYDGDGDIDVLVANFNVLSLGVAVNAGNGTFSSLPITNYTSFNSSTVSYIQAADLDGDKDLDFLLPYSQPISSIVPFFNGGIITTVNSDNTAPFHIYPNPSNGRITVNSISFANISGTIKVIDMLGQIVYAKNVTPIDFPLIINLPDQPDGIYLVEISNGSSQFTSKFAIKK